MERELRSIRNLYDFVNVALGVVLFGGFTLVSMI